MTEPSVHASCVLIGEGAILIRGPSGSGKSTLALALLDAARRDGGLARLIGDDRVRLAAQGGRLVARGVSSIEGLIECRGVGILREAADPAGIVRLVVDLGEEPPTRLPFGPHGRITLCGIVLPHVTTRIRGGLETVLLRQYRVGNDTLMKE